MKVKFNMKSGNSIEIKFSKTNKDELIDHISRRNEIKVDFLNSSDRTKLVFVSEIESYEVLDG